MKPIIFTFLIPHAAAQISAFFESGPACIKDCQALQQVNSDCMQAGQVNVDCLCGNPAMQPLYAGGSCGCGGSDGDAFRSWLDGPNICSSAQAAFDATGVRTTSTAPTPTSTSEKSTASVSKTTMETSSKSKADTATITLVTGTMTGFVQSPTPTQTKPSLATSGADSSNGDGSWDKKKKWAVPVIAVAAVGAVLVVLLLSFCLWRRRQDRTLGAYAGVKGGGGLHKSPPWWTLGGLFGGRKKVRESAMSEAGHGLVGGGGTEYQGAGGSFEPPRTRVLQQDQYGNYLPRTQGPAYIAPGSYPHGRPLSPVEEMRSAAPTPSIASTAGSPPPQEGYGAAASTFRDIPEGAAIGGAGQAGYDYQGSRIPPAAPSAGLGVPGGATRNATPPSRQVSNSSSDFSYTDSDVSNARSSPYPILSQKRKPVRRQFNPEDAPSASSSVRSAFNPVSPVSPLDGGSGGNGGGFSQPPTAPQVPLSPLRHPRIRNSPQYYEDYNN